MTFPATVISTFFTSKTISATPPEIINFDTNFTDKTMRVDFFHSGDAKSEVITLDHVYKYGTWAGSRKDLIDNFNNGRFYAKVYDKKTGQLIYSKGFDSFFGEYQSTTEAAEGIKRAYHESVLIPFPKKGIMFALESRDRKKMLKEIFRTTIDPSDVSIIKDEVKDSNVSVYRSHYSGNPHKMVDVAILGEGYTAADKDKFERDLGRFTGTLFRYEPFKSNQSRFNIYGVLKPSEESGVDEPRADIFKNTTLNATFNSLGSERYLMTEDNRAMRDLAAHVPYDSIYLMVNHERYGGGGIYNLYAAFTTDNQWGEYVFIHEFGHSFGGLGDEYYTSAVVFNDFYPKGTEPTEPNITALLDPKKLKWQHLVTEGTLIPTPWEKRGFDTMDMRWQKLRQGMNAAIAELKKSRAPADKIKIAQDEYDAKGREHSHAVNKYLGASKYTGVVGAFEGAGYSSEGLYRPQLDCIMFSKGNKPFCDVCKAAIESVIDHHTE
jgi:hypothetical protein